MGLIRYLILGRSSSTPPDTFRIDAETSFNYPEMFCGCLARLFTPPDTFLIGRERSFTCRDRLGNMSGCIENPIGDVCNLAGLLMNVSGKVAQRVGRFVERGGIGFGRVGCGAESGIWDWDVEGQVLLLLERDARSSGNRDFSLSLIKN
jgi:hypothetical protein